MRRLGALLLSLLLAASLGAAPASAARLPSKKAWRAESERIMRGSLDYLDARVQQRRPTERLALNLDIDNTALATHYDKGAPVAPVLRLARRARTLGVSVFFNTARPRRDLSHATQVLREAGYRVDRICGRRPGESVVRGKRRCRAQFVSAGYTIIANVGNSPTDFKGGNYERRYKLRSYGGRLS